MLEQTDYNPVKHVSKVTLTLDKAGNKYSLPCFLCFAKISVSHNIATKCRVTPCLQDYNLGARMAHDKTFPQIEENRQLSVIPGV